MKFKMIHKKKMHQLKVDTSTYKFSTKKFVFLSFPCHWNIFFVGDKGTAYKINLQYSFVGILNHDVFSMRVENQNHLFTYFFFCLFCKELVIFLSLFNEFVGGIFLLENQLKVERELNEHWTNNQFTPF